MLHDRGVLLAALAASKAPIVFGSIDTIDILFCSLENDIRFDLVDMLDCLATTVAHQQAMSDSIVSAILTVGQQAVALIVYVTNKANIRISDSRQTARQTVDRQAQ
jgi:hypothetical protein